MRIPNTSADTALLSALLFPFLTAALGNIDCHHVRVDKTSFDLSELEGPQSVIHSQDQGVSFLNTTYTIDICKPLTRAGNVPKEDQCPGGTRLCGIERVINKEEKKSVLEKVIPIAGQLKDQGGGDLDAKWTLLSNSPSNSDTDKEGLRVEMGGGFFGKGKDKKSQKAIIEFLCDKERTGLENNWKSEDEYSAKTKREEDEGDEKEPLVDDKDLPSLTFLSYDNKDSTDILRLQWRTKYACEGAKEEKDAERAGHWGFFTWFIIIAFLSTAAYLIFGSWLNYNRYGARGWDLLPHGDTIRDVPYLFKDWMRRVVNTVQGSGSRGGYAAV
ncbi:hypothetical protein PVAG01_03792 [Phlyctema vagabunda]|uniref:Autophagy-related protein 27 n=1 Tax=Phlyctema vagabunda TaxID=108571 RepID=A0ABR4PMF2_9HELO